MPDPELQWIPDKAQAIRPRRRAISVAVLAISCVGLGIAIGRLTTRIPAGTASVRPDVVGAPSAKAPVEPLAGGPGLKSNPEAAIKKSVASPGPHAEPKASLPPVVLINPGTADKDPNAASEEMRAKALPMRESKLRRAPQDDREHRVMDDGRDVASPPARDYQSLREYMLSR
jgi:hypothetical protein